jgi:hypothetical protein
MSCDVMWETHFHCSDSGSAATHVGCTPPEEFCISYTWRISMGYLNEGGGPEGVHKRVCGHEDVDMRMRIWGC